MDVENETQPAGGHKATATSVATNNGLRSPQPPPPFTAMTRLEGNTAVVMFHGELDMGSIAVLVSSLIGIAFVVEELVLDFSELEFIDACGLRTIASTVQQVRAYGGSVRIRSPSPRIGRLLDLVDFKQIVEIQPQAFS